MHPERTTLKIHLVARVLHVNESLDHIITVNLHSGTQGNHHVHIVIRTTNAIDTGYGCYDNDIFSLRQRCRGRKAQLINLIIYRGILRYISVRLRHIRFRLIIIIVGDKILNGILREKFFHFSVQLPRQCLVVGNNQRRLIQRLNDICHRKGLSRTGHTQQCFKLVAFFESFD